MEDTFQGPGIDSVTSPQMRTRPCWSWFKDGNSISVNSSVAHIILTLLPRIATLENTEKINCLSSRKLNQKRAKIGGDRILKERKHTGWDPHLAGLSEDSSICLVHWTWSSSRRLQPSGAEDSEEAGGMAWEAGNWGADMNRRKPQRGKLQICV